MNTSAQVPLDRSLQRTLLEAAYTCYPDTIQLLDLAVDAEVARRELAYLQEHGLVTFRAPEYAGMQAQIRDVRITAKGIDFLAADGGLSAILGVVTVRIEADAIKAMLAHAVSDSGETPTVKQALIAQIRALPAEAVKEVATAGVQAGIRHAPDVVQWLRSVLGGWLS